jgi:hypothetical protein
MSWNPRYGSVSVGKRPRDFAPSQSNVPASTSDAVTGQELRRGVEDEIGAVLERPHQPRRGERRVDEQRQAVLVREFGDPRHVEDVEAGVAQGLAEQQPCPGAYRCAPRVDVPRIDERRLDAEPRQREIEQVVRAAVQGARRDDVAASPHQRDDREVQRRLPAGRRDRADAALERRDALLEHRAGRVGDAGVDVPRALHVEQRCRVVGVGKHERRALVDRRRARPGGRIGPGPGVERERVEAMGLGSGHRVMSCSRRW